MKNYLSKFKLIHILIVIIGFISLIFFYGKQKIQNPEKSTFTQSTTKKIQRPEGYWLSNDHSFYIDENHFILMDNNNYQMNYFNILKIHEGINNVDYSLEIEEEKSNEKNIFEEPIDISFTKIEDDLKISFKQNEMIIDEEFFPSKEDTVQSQLVDAVETNGMVIPEQLPELTIDDFKGYWYSFDKNNIENYPYGTTYVYIDDDYSLSGWSGSDYIISSFHDYRIENNQLTYQADAIDMEMSIALDNNLDHERDIYESTMTLFKEENNRDRLIVHSTGSVLQKVEIEELSEVQTLYGTDDQTFSIEKIAWTEDFIDEFHTIYEKQEVDFEDINTDAVVQLENYPYSLGKLSKKQLYNEYQIITQQIDHPEKIEDEEVVIKQLISNKFESTPSFNSLDFTDNGYYFDESYEGNVASYTYGFGGRTEWQSGPGYAEISEIEFKDNVYTLTIKDSNYHEQGDTIKLFRINENVIYTEDPNGEFTNRYEKDSDWNDYNNLPRRSEYY